MRLLALHDHAKQAALDDRDLHEYEDAKTRIASAICSAQHVALRPGQDARTAFRVAVLHRIEVTIGGALQKTATMDVSLSGFTALLSTNPAVGTRASFRLVLPSCEPIVGTCTVSGVQRTSTSHSHRATFQFGRLRPIDAEYLENALFDALLQRFRA
jgi:hypothetical protein